MRNHHSNTARNIAIGSVVTALGAGIATYAAYKLTSNKNTQQENEQCDTEDFKIIKSASDVLVNKIGATKSDIEEARMLNKTAYELAEDNGFSREQLKMFINQERTREIDELALNRKITGEVADKVKHKIEQHTDDWDGRLC